MAASAATLLAQTRMHLEVVSLEVVSLHLIRKLELALSRPILRSRWGLAV